MIKRGENIDNPWNLLESKSGERIDEIRLKFNDYKLKIDGFIDSNEKMNLKSGDKILFIGGYYDNIEMISEILGFDSDGMAYILWECFWFPIDLNKRMIKKVII